MENRLGKLVSIWKFVVQCYLTSDKLRWCDGSQIFPLNFSIIFRESSEGNAFLLPYYTVIYEPSYEMNPVLETYIVIVS